MSLYATMRVKDLPGDRQGNLMLNVPLRGDGTIDRLRVNRGSKCVLGWKMVVDRTRQHADRSGDVAHRSPRVTPLAKQHGRLLDDLGASIVGAATVQRHVSTRSVTKQAFGY